MKKEPEAGPPATVSLWKCPQCLRLNKFGESEKCIECKFNLGFIDDLTACMVEMEEKAYLELSQSKTKKQEAPALKEDEWICENCRHVNVFTSALVSCICSKCKVKNEVVELLISAKQNQVKDEQKYIDSLH